MMETNKGPGIPGADRTRFGGCIRLSDFSTEPRRKSNVAGSPLARRIMQDQRFDQQCRKNDQNRREHGWHKRTSI